MKILIACEESQAVCKAFRAKGHEAFSCDTQDCSGGHPEWHIKGSALDHLNDGWDMLIAFPPCTYLTCTAEWAYKDSVHLNVKPGTLIGADRRSARIKAIEFVQAFLYSQIPLIAIENPVGVLSSIIGKPAQTIHPYEFGHNASKRTCLWLQGLPTLTPTKYIEPRLVAGRPRWANQTDSGQNNLPPTKDRAKLRSKTYSGIATAMAEQWSDFIAKTEPCGFCGYRFDMDLCGLYGCPNCYGEGLEQTPLQNIGD